jgi:hypothetical protein
MAAAEEEPVARGALVPIEKAVSLAFPTESMTHFLASVFRTDLLKLAAGLRAKKA